MFFPREHICRRIRWFIYSSYKCIQSFCFIFDFYIIGSGFNRTITIFLLYIYIPYSPFSGSEKICELERKRARIHHIDYQINIYGFKMMKYRIGWKKHCEPIHIRLYEMKIKE